MEEDHVGDGSQTPDVSDAGNKEVKTDLGEYKKLLGQLKKTKDENKSLLEKINQLGVLQEKISKVEKEDAKRVENEFIEKGEFKKLLELREKEIADLRKGLQDRDSEVTNYKKDLHDTWKANAIQNALPGKVRKPEYFSFVDFDQVVIDPSTGKVDPQSVTRVAGDFMKNYGDLIDTTHVKGMPNKAPGSQNKYASADDFKNMSLADMRKNLKSLVTAKKIEMGYKT